MDSIVNLYRFIHVADPHRIARWLRARCRGTEIKGTVHVATEGINAALWGSEGMLRNLVADIEDALAIDLPNAAWSHVGECEPFKRLRIRAKDEILRFAVSALDPTLETGERVATRDWNAMLEAPDVTVVDVRNRYEVAIGNFDGAVDPSIESFGEFAQFVARDLSKHAHTRVALYCTGGIRCEKASAYLLERGFQEVYQLDGGILGYLSDISPEGTRWRGECFVFDHRVALTSALEPGEHVLCHGCRRPVAPTDTQSEDYREGVHCAQCIGELTDAQRRGFEERRRQMHGAS